MNNRPTEEFHKDIPQAAIADWQRQQAEADSIWSIQTDKLNDMSSKFPELSDPLEFVSEEQKKKWDSDVILMIHQVRKQLPEIDERFELADVQNEGMLKLDENEVPYFTPEGKALVKLMQLCSEQIVKEARSLQEVQFKAAELLIYTEQIGIQSITKLQGPRRDALQRIQKNIITQSIENFARVFDSNLQPLETPEAKALVKTAIHEASEPAKKSGADIIKALHDELNDQEAQARFEKIRNANAFDVFNTLKLIFRNSNQDKQLDITLLENQLKDPESMSWLEAPEQEKMWKLFEKSKQDASPTLNDDELMDMILVLESVHLSWAASQFPRQLKGEDRFTRDAYQQFPAIKVTYAQKSYERAVLEIMKDLVHLE